MADFMIEAVQIERDGGSGVCTGVEEWGYRALRPWEVGEAAGGHRHGGAGSRIGTVEGWHVDRHGGGLARRSARCGWGHGGGGGRGRRSHRREWWPIEGDGRRSRSLPRFERERPWEEETAVGRRRRSEFFSVVGDGGNERGCRRGGDEGRTVVDLAGVIGAQWGGERKCFPLVTVSRFSSRSEREEVMRKGRRPVRGRVDGTSVRKAGGDGGWPVTLAVGGGPAEASSASCGKMVSRGDDGGWPEIFTVGWSL